MSATMLNLAFVKSFVTLVETGSYSAAARALGLAQPTVSQQIRKLESSLGVALIQRSHAACTPTAQGRAVLPYARALLASADRLCAAAAGDRVCIGCSGNIAAYYISGDLKRFVERQQDAVRWDIRTATNPELGDLLLNGEIDIAAMEWPDRRPGLRALPWRREPLVAILPRDHPLAGADRLTLDDLSAIDLIGGEPGTGTGTLLKAALGDRADRLRITHNLHSTEAVKSTVRAGLGCSIVLRGTAQDEADAGLLAMLPIDGAPLEKTFYLTLPADLPDDSLSARLASFLAGETATAG